MTEAVLVAGCRTAIGARLGHFVDVSVPRLGGVVIKEALRRAGVDGGDVDAVVMGNATQAGVGPNPARLAATRAGIPMGVPATTVNKLDLSGMHAIALAALLVTSGQHSIVVAGGMESASTAPRLVLHRGGGRDPRAGDVAEAWHHDGEPRPEKRLPSNGQGSGLTQQATFADTSRQRAVAACAVGRWDEEIVRVPLALTGPDRGFVGERDEALSRRNTGGGKKPVISSADPNAVPTPADGAAAVVVTTRERAQRMGLSVLASLGSYGTVAGGPPAAPPEARALHDVLRRDGALTLQDLDLVEIHEESAEAVIHAVGALKFPVQRVNVNGGALALGHPIGMSGARMVLTLAYELRRRGGGVGAAAVRGDGGQCEGLLVRVAAR